MAAPQNSPRSDMGYQAAHSLNNFLGTDLPSILAQLGSMVFGPPGIADGGTQGQLALGNTVSFMVDRVPASKVATDDFWDLSGEAATDDASYRAYLLLSTVGGTASFTSGADAASEALAISGLPRSLGSNVVMGYFLAAPECSFAVTLSEGGTIGDGMPSGYPYPSDFGTTYLDSFQVEWAS